jgi:hypothetical protein
MLCANKLISLIIMHFYKKFWSSAFQFLISSMKPCSIVKQIFIVIKTAFLSKM